MNRLNSGEALHWVLAISFFFIIRKNDGKSGKRQGILNSGLCGNCGLEWLCLLQVTNAITAGYAANAQGTPLTKTVTISHSGARYATSRFQLPRTWKDISEHTRVKNLITVSIVGSRLLWHRTWNYTYEYIPAKGPTLVPSVIRNIQAIQILPGIFARTREKGRIDAITVIRLLYRRRACANTISFIQVKDRTFALIAHRRLNENGIWCSIFVHTPEKDLMRAICVRKLTVTRPASTSICVHILQGNSRKDSASRNKERP